VTESQQHLARAVEAGTGRGPVRPTTAAAVAHRPLDRPGVRLTDGLLGEWQRRNRGVSLPLALRQLERAGNLDNLRLVSAGQGEPYQGPRFADSDLYKTLEAIGWELGQAGDAEAVSRAPGQGADAETASHAPVRTGGPDAASPDLGQAGADLGQAGAESLAEFGAAATTLLAAAQQDDGYLNSYVQATGRQRYAQLESSHELYCAGHLIQAAIAADRGAGDGALLRIAVRLADHLVSEFLGRTAGLDGHPIIETALVELYRQTGTLNYLELARQFVDQRGRGLTTDPWFGARYSQDHLPVREAPALVGHAVRALYLESGVVDVAAETGDAGLLAASIARWEDMVASKTALTGGNGSRHSGEAFGDGFELPPDRAYNETCAAIASFQWSWRLLLATGDAKYADLMERVLYNGFGAAISADGQRFFYVNPLQRRDDHHEDDGPARRSDWFSCACCPPNIIRLLCSLQHYLATVAGDTLHLHQITASQIDAPLAGGVLSLRVATEYPWHGSARFGVRAAPAAECGVAVRVPGWSRDVTISLNGDPLAVPTNGHGYLVLRRRWRPGDELVCTFDVRPRLTYPGRRIDALRGTAAVERGPLVYCFEQADQPDGLSVEDLALRPGGLTERTATLPGPGPTVVVEADAVRLPPLRRDGLPYRALPDASTAGAPVIAVAIPYFQWDNRDGRAMRVWLPLS
jgi:DUF1680 family protein